MIAKLKQIYHGHCIQAPSETNHPEKYFWVRAQGRQLGIEKSILSDQEKQLLKMFFTVEEERKKHLSRNQKRWYDALFSDYSTPAPCHPFRFVHFYLQREEYNEEAFSEACESLFLEKPVILWRTAQEGVLIETNDHQRPESYEALAETLTGDFLIDVFLYVGIKYNHQKNPKQLFIQETEAFTLSRKLARNRVLYHAQQLPLFMLHRLDARERTGLFYGLLDDVEDDRDLLKSVQTYLETGMNVTTAARELFIHRNSMQYRVEKFIEKTGIDIKKFEQAVTVYLALLGRTL